MVAALSSSLPPTETQKALPASGQGRPSFFHRLLSELNPLQYVPVVGTIYRAITGDVIPAEARFAGSLVVSGLLSGPIGVALNLGTAALERVTGIDPEVVGTRLLADIGIGGHAAAATAAVQTVKAEPTAPLPAVPVADSEKSWSVAQLTAYGVVQGAQGTLSRGALTGADVLNSLELGRIRAGVGFTAVV